jgi:CBS domain-containing protein
MLVSEVMTQGCKYCSSSDSLAAAAKLMASQDIGVVPVAENDKLIGMVTDRDIVVRGVASDLDLGKLRVTELMTDKVYYCFDDQNCSDVADNMAELQVRRLPVVDREKNLVGIVSLGDLASQGAANKAKKALLGVSTDQN